MDYFWHKIDSLRNSFGYEGEVYTLRANSSRIMNLRSWSIRRRVDSNVVVHNNALHCITSSASSRKIVLGVFDIDEEKYVEFALLGKKKPMASVGSFNGFLSLSIWTEKFEIWVMKKHGMWTNELVLTNSPLIYSPYGITLNGNFWQSLEDALYDAYKQLIEKEVRSMVIFLEENVNYSMLGRDHMLVAEFVESMVSVSLSAEEIEEKNAIIVSTSI